MPSALLFFGLLFVPESPRWLAEMGHERQALEILERLGGKTAGVKNSPISKPQSPQKGFVA